MAKTSSTAKGFAILSATGLISKILSLIYVPIQTAVVHDAGNAVINIGLQIYIFMFSLSNAGLPNSISKMVSERDALGDYKGSKKIFHVATGVLLVMGVVFSVVLCLGAKSIARAANMPQAGLMLMTISPAFLFTSINCAIRGYFQGKKNMAPTAVSQVIEQFFNSLMTVIFIAIFYFNTPDKTPTLIHKVTNAAAGSAVGTVIGAASASVFLLYIYHLMRGRRQREERLQQQGPTLSTRTIAWMIVGYSIPAIVSSVASNASALIDAFVCSNRMAASGLPAKVYDAFYGQYTTNYQRIISLITFVATALMVALVPSVSSAFSTNDRKSLRHTLVSSYKVLFIFTVPCLAGLTVLAQPVISFIFFNVHQSGAQYLSVWAWSNILLAVISIQSGILIGLGRPASVPINMLVGMALKLVLNYFLVAIPSLNMHGAAIGSAVGWFVTVLLNNYVIDRAAGFQVRYFRLLIKPTLVSAAMGGAAWVIYKLLNALLLLVLRSRSGGMLLISNDIALLAAIAAGAAVYFILMILWKGIRREDILRIPKGERLYSLLTRVPFLKRGLVS